MVYRNLFGEDDLEVNATAVVGDGPEIQELDFGDIEEEAKVQEQEGDTGEETKTEGYGSLEEEFNAVEEEFQGLEGDRIDPIEMFYNNMRLNEEEKRQLMEEGYDHYDAIWDLETDMLDRMTLRGIIMQRLTDLIKYRDALFRVGDIDVFNTTISQIRQWKVQQRQRELRTPLQVLQQVQVQLQ